MSVPKIAYKIFVLGIILSLVYSRTFSLMAVFEGFALAIFLAWFISKVDLNSRSTFMLVWLGLFVIGVFNNMLEAYFFTTQYSTAGSFANALLMPIATTFLESASAVLLLRPKGNRDMAAALKSYLSSRTKSSWVLRILAASVLYLVVYFIFGLMVSSFVFPYYSNASSGLVIPPLPTMFSLEIFRGFVYAVVLLVVFAGIKREKNLGFWVASALLYIPGAFLPLLSSMTSLSVISPVAPFHLVELLADSIVYGYVASRLIGAGVKNA